MAIEVTEPGMVAGVELNGNSGDGQPEAKQDSADKALGDRHDQQRSQVIGEFSLLAASASQPPARSRRRGVDRMIEQAWGLKSQ